MKYITLIILTVGVAFSSCKKPSYSFGEIKTPTNFTFTAVPVGIAAGLPLGNGSGNVLITATAKDALSYSFDFGDGSTVETISSGVVTHKFSKPVTGNYSFNVTVNAYGTGGATSTLTKTISVYIVFQLPAIIRQNLTNGSTRTWITDKNEVGHFGVGPNDQFAPIWYAAPPNSREACAYDDEITFSKDASDNMFINVNNKGQSFVIGAATASYGLSGGDNCYTIATIGVKALAFANATSASTPSNSTRIQFTVPTNGIINFATGGNTYEILDLTPTTMHIRNIGADGNAWFQKLRVKP